MKSNNAPPDNPGHTSLHQNRGDSNTHELAFAAPMRGWLQAGLDTLVLDLTVVSRLDALGAVTLVECGYRAAQVGVALRLVPSPAVPASLTELDLLSRFVCLPSMRHARVVSQ